VLYIFSKKHLAMLSYLVFTIIGVRLPCKLGYLLDNLSGYSRYGKVMHPNITWGTVWQRILTHSGATAKIDRLKSFRHTVVTVKCYIYGTNNNKGLFSQAKCILTILKYTYETHCFYTFLYFWDPNSHVKIIFITLKPSFIRNTTFHHLDMVIAQNNSCMPPSSFERRTLPW